MRQPSPVTLFLDENHCNNARILGVLHAENVAFERFLDHFARGTPDTDWLPFIGSRGWVLLTTDKRIRYHESEKQALREFQVRMFYFSNNNMSGQQMADSLQRALRSVQRICDTEAGAFAAAITRGGEAHVRLRFS